MEFRQLEAFVNAAKYKSFSKAADATFLTQPTISTHVSNLENELGVRLLNRSGREISLTPHGHEFYSYAVELLNTRSWRSRLPPFPGIFIFPRSWKSSMSFSRG